jgi:DNA mismatch repair ATPase MutS
MKAHLLYRDRDFDLGAEIPPNAPDLFQDLDLRTLVAAMACGDELLAGVAGHALLAGLDDVDAVRYRQAVLEDFLSNPAALRDLFDVVVGALEQRRKMWGYAWASSRKSLLSGAREHMEMFVEQLARLRSLADRHLPEMRSEGLRRLFGSLQRDLDDGYLDLVRSQLRRLRLSSGILLSAKLDRDNTGEGYVLRVPERAGPGWRERFGMTARTAYSFRVDPHDEGAGRALEELRDHCLNDVANAVAQAADHVTDYFSMLRVELGFYVGCLNLYERLTEAGEKVCIPEVRPGQDLALAFRNLRDLCLTLRAPGRVTGNDVDADGKSLVVVTGANSGGKSTFLKSVGIAQLMAQAGMFVVADSYHTSITSGVFTHFLREEDPSMTRGRLEEELARMAGLAGRMRPGAMVLFNESFHSTSEREGSEIARQIVRAIREASGRVVFVSHQYDFARSYLDEEGSSTLFLRAELGADGRPDYRLVVAPPLATAYGPQLYREVFAGGPS